MRLQLTKKITKTHHKGGYPVELLQVVLPACISAAATLLVCVLTNHGQLERTRILMEYKLDELAKKVEKHNNLIERTYKLEEQASVMHEQILVANHRIKDLEDKESEHEQKMAEECRNPLYQDYGTGGYWRDWKQRIDFSGRLEGVCIYRGTCRYHLRTDEYLTDQGGRIMKAMLSQPMAGKSEEEIKATREKAIAVLKEKGYEIINTLFTDEWYSNDSMKERGVVQIPLCFLAKSLKNMSLCHAAYFCKGWEKARGCRIEHDAALAYGLTIIYEEDQLMVHVGR